MRTCVPLCGVAELHFVQTITLQFIFSTAWQIPISTIHYSNPSRYSWSLQNVLLCFLSVGLIAAVCFVCVLYRLKLRAWHLQTGYSAPGRFPWAVLDRTWAMRRLLATSNARHDRQLKFLHGRFAPHAPFWQYVRRVAPHALLCARIAAADT